MKWFKHLSSAYTDLAVRQIIEEFGIEGYGAFFLSCELVAQQGKHFCLKKNQNWFKNLELISKIPEKKLTEILQKFSDLNLIDSSAYKKGDLYLRKMSRYADEYTDKVGRVSRQCPDNVGVDKIRIDKIRIDKIRKEKKKAFSSYKEKLTAYENGEKWGEYPYYKQDRMRWYFKKWQVFEEGIWKEFAGNESEIEWR